MDLPVVNHKDYLAKIGDDHKFPIQKFGLAEILTYGAFSYPITFLITDLANRAYGNQLERKVVYLGLKIEILLT